MEKLCLIAPMNSTAEFSLMVDGVKSVLKNKYKFNIIAVCDENINPSYKIPAEITFIKVEAGSTVNEKITKGFEFAREYDATIIFDYYNNNWQEYLECLIREYEKGADIVYTRKYVERKTFFQKVAGFFKKAVNFFYQFFITIACKNKDLKVFNSFQLFRKHITDIIVDMPEKNTYLRNFDCWNGYEVKFVNSEVGEPKDTKVKFWNKNTITAFSLLGTLALFVVLATLLGGFVNYDFKFAYIGLAIVISGFLLFFSLYHFAKNIVDIKLGKIKNKDKE